MSIFGLDMVGCTQYLQRRLHRDVISIWWICRTGITSCTDREMHDIPLRTDGLDCYRSVTELHRFLAFRLKRHAHLVEQARGGLEVAGGESGFRLLCKFRWIHPLPVSHQVV
ncbi:MAG: hypothetical protein N3D71_01155 [Burkholderiaceae bacterium]|nr:hypothetical protein [Burkholderiaceae bacterium]